MSDQINKTRIKVIHNTLEEIADQVVYVGGATVSLYKDRAVTDARVTDDVDIVIEIATYSEYAFLDYKLRKKGFINDSNSKVICRYIVRGIIVDIMPTNGNVFGFFNPWYKDGFMTAMDFQLSSETKIKIFRHEYFLASKIVAFKNRGKNDGRTSSDFEDMVYVLNNRNAIWEELESSDKQVKNFIIEFFKELFELDYLIEWISVHLDFYEQRRVDIILASLYQFCNLK